MSIIVLAVFGYVGLRAHDLFGLARFAQLLTPLLLTSTDLNNVTLNSLPGPDYILSCTEVTYVCMSNVVVSAISQAISSLTKYYQRNYGLSH